MMKTHRTAWNSINLQHREVGKTKLTINLIHVCELTTPMTTEDRPQQYKPGTPSEPRCQKWVFTWNNYTDQNVTELKLFFQEQKCVYLLMGYEHTPNEQNPQWTKHIQGVIHFKDRKRLSWLKNNISSQIHFEQ